MSEVRTVLQGYVDRGSIPGAVALLARGDAAQVHAIGSMRTGPDAPPMEPDTIFRIASITKPITAAGAMLLVDDGTFALDDPVAGWLPEIAAPMVVRTLVLLYFFAGFVVTAQIGGRMLDRAGRAVRSQSAVPSPV